MYLQNRFYVTSQSTKCNNDQMHILLEMSNGINRYKRELIPSKNRISAVNIFARDSHEGERQYLIHNTWNYKRQFINESYRDILRYPRVFGKLK